MILAIIADIKLILYDFVQDTEN